MTKVIHEGKNVKRMRELLGIKQDRLAIDVHVSQQKMSEYEQRELIDPEVLEKIATALHVSVEAIKNFDDEAVNNFINTFNDQSGFNYQCTINPIEKWVEALKKNEDLYERLLESEKDKNRILQEMIQLKK